MPSLAESLDAIQRAKDQAKARAEAHNSRENFYLSRRWRALRYTALRENAERHAGTITCEACRSTNGPWHVDHIIPRSRDRSRELDPANLQVMCADCNTGKGNTDRRDWRSNTEID